MTKIARFMGPTWVLSAPDGPHVGPMSLAIRGILEPYMLLYFRPLLRTTAEHHWITESRPMVAGHSDDRYMDRCQQWTSSSLNTLRPRQNGCLFADDIFTCIFLNENVWIWITISLKFVPHGPINNIPALVQIMANMSRMPGQNGRHFPDDILKCIFFNKNAYISIKISH